MKSLKQCRVHGCARLPRGLGYCSEHLLRYRRFGDPSVGFTPRYQSEEPTPHDLINFTITRSENEEWKRNNDMRLWAWDAVRTDLWHQAHADDASADWSNA